MDVNQVKDLKISLATDQRIEKSRVFTEDLARKYLSLDEATKAKLPNEIKSIISSLAEFFKGVNEIIRLSDDDLLKPVPDTEKISSANRAQDLAFKMVSSIYQAQILIKAGDEDAEEGILKPLVDQINQLQDYSNEQLLPLFSTTQKADLKISDELAFSFDIDRIDDGEGLNYLLRKALEKK
jgi:hypothetical protein